VEKHHLNYVHIHCLKKGVVTMVVKINSKPIHVVEPDAEEKDFSWVYMGVSSLGYLMAFWVLDYCAYLFCSVHPFPFIVWVGKVLAWLGVVL
jgi:hypothetical protein